eukprot:GFYU01004441.1.p1 GENE.GFYU01004441.1~~GFYU01004441.1.p1  ORF type:complete len:582 (+),score=134.18 GFYU01004441.1:129-1874(+)
MYDSVRTAVLCAVTAVVVTHWELHREPPTWLLCVAAVAFIYGVYYAARWMQQQQVAAQAKRLGISVGVVGGGFTGIEAAKRLKSLGIPYVVYEKANSPGGTWYANRYPGCACDVPAQSYSFSWDLNPMWSSFYAPAQEILTYLLAVIKRHDLKISTNQEILSATWKDDVSKWSLEVKDTTTNKVTVKEHNFIISGTGPLAIPNYPDSIPGFGSFKGVAIHSAKWPEDGMKQVTGKKVAVIGSGATAAQLIPGIKDVVGSLTSIQRTPGWVAPREEFPIPRWVSVLFATIPGLMYAHRCAQYIYREFLMFDAIAKPESKTAIQIMDLLADFYKQQIPGDDPKAVQLRKALTPKYKLGCKRILVSDNYLAAFTDPRVKLEGRRITKFTPEGLVVADTDGKQSTEELKFDVIIYCTGYKVTGSDPTEPLVSHTKGANGKLMTECFNPHPIAYKGAFLPDLPNYTMGMGPNTGLGHNSVVIMIECGMTMVEEMYRRVLAPFPWQRVGNASGHTHTQPRFEVVQKDAAHYTEVLKKDFKATSWSSGCLSWYTGKDGEQFVLYPYQTFVYWWNTLTVDAGKFRLQQL